MVEFEIFPKDPCLNSGTVESVFFSTGKISNSLNLLINFIFAQTLFHIALRQILKNHAILINHGSFLQEKDLLQHDRFQF